MENAFYDFYSLVVSFSHTTQLVNKNRTRAFSVKQSLYLELLLKGEGVRF